MTEIFLPLNAKIEFNSICRTAIIKMEKSGGINDEIKQDMIGKLKDKFFDITVEGTQNARYGTDILLKVNAKYKYNGLTVYS